jgi:hypothetical protein
MEASRSRVRRAAAAACAAAIACSLAACDALLNLGSYSGERCTPYCDANTPPYDVGLPFEGGDEDGFVVPPPPWEAGNDADGAGDDDAEGGPLPDADAGDGEAGDGGDASDADAEGGAPFDVVPVESGPTVTQLWVHWPMPNPPGAPIEPGSDASLPHPMEYDAGTDAGMGFVWDDVTHLAWEEPATAQPTDYDSAVRHCSSLPLLNNRPWRVPTRIELVSLIDFTQAPTINRAVFPSTRNTTYWTSSAHLGPEGGAADAYWSVDFGTGYVTRLPSTEPPANLRCVNGGGP